MTSRLSDFMRARAAEVYPEPRDPGHDFITVQMAPLVAAHLQTEALVLDVGAGRGPAAEWFSAQGFEVECTTMSIEDAKELLLLPVKVHTMDMHDMPRDFGWMEAFDCVWARHVLEHSPIPFFVLTEFARALKPGGILYAEMPAPDTACGHAFNPNHYSVFGKTMWLSLIARAGFEILEVRDIRLLTPCGPDQYLSFICRKA